MIVNYPPPDTSDSTFEDKMLADLRTRRPAKQRPEKSCCVPRPSEAPHDIELFARVEERQPRFRPLTVRSPSEIMAMQFDPADMLTENGYLQKGNALVIAGMGGLGKSRFILQMAISCILGKPFIGWNTKAGRTKWLILQTENGNRRLQVDISRMMKSCSPDELAILDECLRIHTLETEDDAFVTLSTLETADRIAALTADFPANVIVYDVLRDFATGDLNSDEAMTETCRAISRVTRMGDPTRIPVVVHHALTGKAGAAKATGFDRGSFSRNSKVLLGWTRGQINLAPYSPDSNDVVVVASGKANDAEEFAIFAVRLDPDTMSYSLDESVDLGEWQAQVSGKAKAGPKATIQQVVDAVPRGLDGITKARLVKAVMAETGCCSSFGYILVAKADAEKRIIRRSSDKLYIVK